MAEEPLESRSRDHYKQSVVLQRTEGSDVTDKQMLRRRSLAIAHLYLTSASLARTRTRSLTRTVSVQTSPNSSSDSTDTDLGKPPNGMLFRPKSEYLLNRYSDCSLNGVNDNVNEARVTSSSPPKSGYSLHRSTDFSVNGVNKNESETPGSSPPSQLRKPKSEHHLRQPRRRGFSVERPVLVQEETKTVLREETTPSVVQRPRGVRLDRPKSEYHPSQSPLLEYRDVIIRDSDRKRVVPRRPKTERPVSSSSKPKTKQKL